MIGVALKVKVYLCFFSPGKRSTLVSAAIKDSKEIADFLGLDDDDDVDEILETIEIEPLKNWVHEQLMSKESSTALRSLVLYSLVNTAIAPWLSDSARCSAYANPDASPFMRPFF